MMRNMPSPVDRFTLSRRRLLAGAGAASLLALPWPAAAEGPGDARYTLTARTGKAALQGAGKPETGIWGFEGTAPGPVLRVRQGHRLDVKLVNQLAQPTTIHWHGIRVPNDMDGVPGLTQDAVKPGETYPYSFVCADAGTFWYHPHGNSAEQLGRGRTIGWLVFFPITAISVVAPWRSVYVRGAAGPFILDLQGAVSEDFG